MRFSNHALDDLVHSPLVFSPFDADLNNQAGAPGIKKLIATESFTNISTEDGKLLETES
jgi:hypothetical protein